MSDFISKSNGTVRVPTFDEMIKQFGVVTVMNARVYTKPLYKITSDTDAIIDASDLTNYKAHDIVKALLACDAFFKIDTLKIANINMEGPTKTVTGGQYANPLIKFGKTATIEMQDALGRADAIELLGGGIIEDYTSDSTRNGLSTGNYKVVHIGQDFAGAKTILGESFFIDRVTGEQVKVYIVIYSMLPDSIFNLTQDAEGDATVFDLNGSLLAVDILVGDGDNDNEGTVRGVFYSVLPQIKAYSEASTATLTYAAATGADDYVSGYIAGKEDETYVVNTSVSLPTLVGYSWYADSAAETTAITSIVVPAGGVSVYLKQNA